MRLWLRAPAVGSSGEIGNPSIHSTQMHNKQPEMLADISVITDPYGQVIIFQGLFKQGLIIPQDHVSRFLRDPAHAALLLVPSFAATALSTYLLLADIRSIAIERDSAVSDDYKVYIKTLAGPTIGYFSDGEATFTARGMSVAGLDIAITRREVLSLDRSGLTPVMSIVAGLSEPQSVSYLKRFATHPSVIRDAVESALQKSKA